VVFMTRLGLSGGAGNGSFGAAAGASAGRYREVPLFVAFERFDAAAETRVNPAPSGSAASKKEKTPLWRLSVPR
jgi:hypothetical protein